MYNPSVRFPRRARLCRPEITDGVVHPNCRYHPGHHKDRAGQYRLQHAPPHLPGADQRECIAIQRVVALDLLKTQIENDPKSSQSNHQKPEITSQAYQ